MLAACPYPALFEPQSVPRPSGAPPALAPYAIETPFADAMLDPSTHRDYAPGEHYHFDMVLMTPAAIRQLVLIIGTWKAAFALGVGPRDGKAELHSVEHRLADSPPNIIYSIQRPALQTHRAALYVPEFASAEDVHLSLQTPLRIEQRGKLIREQDLHAGLFLRHLIRRISFHIRAQQPHAFSLQDIHHLNALADQVREGERRLSWHDWQRYSSRQQQKMKLGGLIGHWQLLQVPPQLLPFLYLGQWLHVGKESAFGLGKYRWLQAGFDTGRKFCSPE